MFKKIAAASLLSIALASSAHANLLTNPGFESGDFTGWTVGGSAPLGYGVGTAGQSLANGYYGPAAVEVASGTYAAWATTRNAAGDKLLLSQTIDFSAGTFNIGFTYGSNQGPFGNSTAILLDGAQIATGYGVGNSSINNGFQTENVTFDVTSGLHTVTFQLSGSGTAPVSISADNFYVSNINGDSQVPEPSMIALLGLGMVGLGLARRQKQ